MKEDAKVKNAAIRKNEFEEKEVQKKTRKAEKNVEKLKADDAKQGGGTRNLRKVRSSCSLFCLFSNSNLNVFNFC